MASQHPRKHAPQGDRQPQQQQENSPAKPEPQQGGGPVFKDWADI